MPGAGAIVGQVMKVVIEKDGECREVFGWRKWAIAIPAILVAAIVLALVTVIVLGFAVTLGAVLLFAIPAALVLAALAQVVMRREAGSRRE